MKKILIGVTCMIVILMLTGIGQADIQQTFPPQKAGLMAKLADGDALCAIFTLLRGTIEIDCAKPAMGGGFNVTVNTCTTSGTLQKCSPSGTINYIDASPMKCMKVCGPGNGTGYKMYK